MPEKTKKNSARKRTSAKDLPKTSKTLSATHMKKVRGGEIIGIRGESTDKKHAKDIDPL